MNKIINIFIVSIIIIASLLVVSPTITYAETGGVNIGDTQVLDGGYVSVCVGFTEKGIPEWQVDLGTPQYLDDKVTKIDTQWYSDGNGGYVSGNNKFKATAQSDELITVQSNDGQQSVSWQPDVSISNLSYTLTNYSNGIVNNGVNSVRLLDTDPINENYHNNTLEWDYGNGLYHRFRLIEGMCLEYYVITQPINGDYNIQLNMISTNATCIQKPVAWDNKGNQVNIEVDGNHNITLRNADNINNNLVYPIYIDPDLTFYSTSSDGYLGYQVMNIAPWVSARTTNIANNKDTTSLTSAIKSSYYYGNPPTCIINRSFYYFDSASIPDAVTVTNVEFDLYLVGQLHSGDAGGAYIVSGMPTYPHDPLAMSDYNYTNYGSFASNYGYFTGSMSAGYNKINTNNSAALASIINKTGYTKLCVITNLDYSNSAPTGQNYYTVYAYEQGASFSPKLIVTYIANTPAITAVTASSILSTTARLNSLVTEDGSEACQVRFGYGKISHIATDFESYTTKTSWSSAIYNTNATPYYDATSLDDSTTYYFRVQIKNSSGNSTSTNEISFTTYSSVPTISAVTASMIAKTSARLSSMITYDGYDNCQVRFGYGAVSHIAADFESYTTKTSWTALIYTTSSTPYYDASSLTGSTTYYFRVQVRNATDNSTSTNEISFATPSAIDNISTFQGIPTSDTISLTWVKSNGSTNTLIMAKIDTYSSSNTDGTLIYLDTLSTYDYSGLDAGKIYYFSAWGESGGVYSTIPMHFAMSTLPASVGGFVIETPTDMPAGWADTPAIIGFTDLPIYPVLNNAFDSLGVPQENGWFMLYMIATTIIGFLIYFATKSPTGGAGIAFIMLIIGWSIHLLPFYIILIFGGVCLGVWQLKSAFSN